MTQHRYRLGPIGDIELLYPPAKWVNEDVGLHDYLEVIAHYTTNSLLADGFVDATASVSRDGGDYVVTIEHAEADAYGVQQFGQRHRLLFSEQGGLKAVSGMNMMKELGVWNPMAGFPVNDSPADGDCKWSLFPPLGLNVVGQRGCLLMHYPPWQVLQQATFLEVMTMSRWSTVLKGAGVPEEDVSRYRTFIDVNPIAAPGSGQSEYPNDYFPIMMASAFFDGLSERDYIRSMLELYLNPPGWKGTKYTLPLLICGSDLYDPQAPAWFRTAYKDIMPTDEHGIPITNVLQVGEFQLRPDSELRTPYMIANHMIAAGVTGKCGGDPGAIPNIRVYEAQDLVAASFLHAYADEPDLDPVEAKRRACQRWFGNDDGSGAPNPPKASDDQIICALAQMDLFFCPGPPPHPEYDFDTAMERCAGADNKPCCSKIGPGA